MPESGPLALTIDLRKERNLRESKILFKSAVVNNVEISPPGEGTRIRSNQCATLITLSISENIFRRRSPSGLQKPFFFRGRLPLPPRPTFVASSSSSSTAASTLSPPTHSIVVAAGGLAGRQAAARRESPTRERRNGRTGDPMPPPPPS